jgi:septal ring factor EnvC (AmiA/AmiB activator)
LPGDGRRRTLDVMNDENVSKDTALILSEVRSVSAAVTSLTRHVDRIDDRLGRVEHDVSEIKTDVGVIKNAVSEISVDLDDHERRITRLESRTATSAD